MRLRIVANITASVEVVKYFAGAEDGPSRPFQLNLLQVDIKKNTGNKKPSEVVRELKKEYRKILKERYNDAIGQTVMPYLSDEDKADEFFEGESETQFKVADDYVDTYEELEKQLTVQFDVISEATGRKFGSQRLFRVGLRELWSKGIMYENKGEEGCAYNYLLDVFVNKNKGFKKFAKDKESINLAISLPRPEDKENYEEWKKLYWDDFHSQDWENQFPTIIPNNECDEDDSWMKYHYDSLSKTDYSAKDIEKSMTILELVRWCVTSQVSLNVLTGNNHTYLNYNPRDFKLRNNKQIPSILVLAKDNHAYFVKDKSIKRSIGQSVRVHSSIDGLVIPKKSKAYDYEQEDKKHLFVDDGIVEPPPTPQEIMNLTNTIYYCNKRTLNGLVNHLGIYHDFQPIYLNGSIASIKEAIYPEGLSIMTEEAKPEWIDITREIDDSDLNKLYEEIPELKERRRSTPFPSYSEIGKAISKRMNIKTDSNLNGMMRKIFSDNEIKPEIRSFHNDEWIEGYKEDWDVRSFDIERAYSNALKVIKPCYFDSLTQPQKYHAQTFNPNWFYLCYNKKDDYPCRGKGLVLYHGSMLELMREDVDIKYVIKPSSRGCDLKGKEFVDECEKLEKACPSISAKKLVNCWVGSLKKKEGIVGYSIYTDRSVEQASEYLNKGYSIRPINNKGHRGCIRIMSKPNYRECLSSGQPIRLAVIDYINSILYQMKKDVSLVFLDSEQMLCMCCVILRLRILLKMIGITIIILRFILRMR